MNPWNNSTAEAQPSLTAPYSYLPSSTGQYQPQVLASNYSQGSAGSSMNIQYSSQRQTIPQSQPHYSNITPLYAGTEQRRFQPPPPGSLEALELEFRSQQAATNSIQNVPSFNVISPQPYTGDATHGRFGHVGTSFSFPGTPNNATIMPSYPLVDQNMLAAGAGPSSAYSTPPTFYDSEGAWSFDSCGQEIQTQSTSTTQLSQPRSTRGSSLEIPPGSDRTNPEASYDCPVDGCSKTFNRSYNYRAHMETHSANRVYPFDCPVEGCDKRFRRKTDLQRHHLSVHEKLRDHQCEFCGRFFSRKDTLGRHREDGCSRRWETRFDLPASGGPAE